ncbi:MAG: TonB-dependent receptor [Bacteroidota bacterium]
MKAALLFLLLVPGSAAEAGAVRGTVTAAEDGHPLPGVNVTAAGTSRGTATGVQGTFFLGGLRPGRFSLSFSRLGYRRETLEDVPVGEGDTTVVSVRLVPIPIQTEDVVVTASKREQSLLEVPLSVAVVDGSTLSLRNNLTLDEALRSVPGVNMTEYQVNIRGSSGYSRGAGSRVLMLVDGIPFLTGDTRELNFETIPVGIVDRVEVVKGAGSALYGSSALGGVINVLTRPVGEEPRTAVRAYGGFYGEPSYNAWTWGGGTRTFDGQSAEHSFSAGDLGVLLYGSRQADDGYRQNDFRRRINGYLKTRYRFPDGDAATLTLNVMEQRRGSFLYWRDLAHALVPPEVQQGDAVRSTRFFLSGQYAGSAAKGGLFTVRAMWFRNRWNDTIDTLVNDSRSDVMRAEAQWSFTLSSAHVFTAGAEGFLEGVRSDLFGTRRGGGGAVYGQDEFRIGGDVRVSLGARYDLQDLDSLPSSSQFNPKAGILWTVSGATAVRASFGRGFRAPSAAEAFITTQAGGLDIVPNPALRPERSYSYEVGVTHFVGEALQADLAAFQADLYDLIEPRFVPLGGRLKGQFNNVTRARVQGLETTLRAAAGGKRVLVETSHTYAFGRDLTDGGVLKYRPRHVATASVLVRLGVFEIGGDFRYLSRTERIDPEFSSFVSDAETRGSTWVTDLRARVRLGGPSGPATVALGVNNVFQYNYVEWIGNLAPPRSVFLVLETLL